jgi:thiopeptide-type bacteriocin biosynthesis protein
MGRVPSDHLTPSPSPEQPTAQALEKAVLAVLASTPPDQAAAAADIRPDDLTDAVQTYRAAGLRTLTAHTDPCDWHQVHIEFADRAMAETTAARLGPLIRRAETNHTIKAWWFTRKSPWWRFRLRTDPATTRAEIWPWLGHLLDVLVSRGLIVQWRTGTIYEPEALAFGGRKAMVIAHRLFNEDSRSIVDYLKRHNGATPSNQMIGRREMSVMLYSALLRGAGQEWNEQADVWHRVESLRPLPADTPLDRVAGLKPGLQHLMTVDVGPSSDLVAADAPLAFAAVWASAFDTSGRALRTLAHEGCLDRGLRDVLALHIIFSWNRMGVPSTTQSVLARAAREVIMPR